MRRIRLLQGLGAASIVGSAVSIRYSFQRQMCTLALVAENQCRPNIVYLAPGMLAALIGIGLFVFAFRRSRFVLRT